MDGWGPVELEGGGEAPHEGRVPLRGDLHGIPEAPVVGLEIRPFNWRLRRAREALGWSRAELARRANLSPTTVGRAEQLRHDRLGPDARWKMALALGVPEDVLFPGEVDALPTDGPRRIEVPILRDDMHALLDGPADRVVEERGMLAALEGDIAQAVARLTPRERRVIELRFGLDGGGARTLEEVAATGVAPSRERTRQIEQKALRKLRHPWHAKRLREPRPDPPPTTGDPKAACLAVRRGEPPCHEQFVPPGWWFAVPVEDLKKPMAWCEPCWTGFRTDRDRARALFSGLVVTPPRAKHQRP